LLRKRTRSPRHVRTAALLASAYDSFRSLRITVTGKPGANAASTAAESSDDALSTTISSTSR
jgi:hypothetical protein